MRSSFLNLLRMARTEAMGRSANPPAICCHVSCCFVTCARATAAAAVRRAEMTASRARNASSTSTGGMEVSMARSTADMRGAC